MKKTLFRLTMLLVTLLSLPSGAWADDVIVSTQTLWNFDDITPTDSYASATTVQYNGMYIKGDDTKNSQVKTSSSLSLGSTFTYTFHGVERTTTNILNVQAGRDNTYSSIAGLGTYLQAVHTGVPGTLYACIACDAPSGQTQRYVYIAYGNNSEGYHVDGEGRTSQANFKILSREATAGGVFAIGSNGAHRIAAIEFVPETVTNPTFSSVQDGLVILSAAQGTTTLTGENADVKTYYKIVATDGAAPETTDDGWVAVPDDGRISVTETGNYYVYVYSKNTVTNTVSSVSRSDQVAGVPVSSEVTIATLTGGTVTLKNGDAVVESGASITAGTTLTVIVGPAEGKLLQTLTITKAGDVTVATTPDGSDANKFTFVMPDEAVTVSATFRDIVTVISTKTQWTLPDDADGALVLENVTNYNNSGLFFRSNNAGGSHAATIATENSSGTFTNGDTWTAKKTINLPGGEMTASATNRAANYSPVGSTDDRCIAFNVDQPGTVYAVMRPGGDNAKELQIFFNGEKTSLSSQDASVYTKVDNNVTYSFAELRASNTESGAYFIGASIACRVASILFVPNEFWYKLTLEESTGGSIAVKSTTPAEPTKDDAGYYMYTTGETATQVTITATPAANFEIDHWEVNGATVDDNATTTITVSMDKANTVQAVYKSTLTYAVTITQPDNGVLTVKNGDTKVTTGSSVASNTVLTITASSDEAYEVDKIYVMPEDGTQTEVENNTYTVTTVPVTFSVTFKSSKLWDFSELTENTGAQTYKSITTVEESKGMYFRGGAEGSGNAIGRSIRIQSESSTRTWTFPDGTDYTKSPGRYAQLPANNTLAPASTLTPDYATTADTDNRALAFTTSASGTVYVAYKGSTGDLTNRNYKLFFKPSSGEAFNEVVKRDAEVVKGYTNQLDVLYYTASEAGTYLIGGDAGINVYAVKFVPAATTYSMTTNAFPENSGTFKKEIIYANDNTKTYETTEYATTFLPNTQVKVTATANNGYEFSKWDDNSTEAVKTVTMDAAKTITATFERTSYGIAVADGIINGTVTIADSKTASPDGEEVGLIITPETDYVLKSVTVKNGSNEKVATVWNDGSYQFIMPATAVTIDAEFAANAAIAEEATWDFSGLPLDYITKVTETEGLYFRAGAKSESAQGRSIQIKEVSTATQTMDGVTLASSRAAGIPTNNALDATAFKNDYTEGTTLTSSDDKNNRSLGFTTLLPGSVYVMVNNKNAKLWFKGNGQTAYADVSSSATWTDGSAPYIMKYDAPEGGSFILGCTESGGINIYAMKFVPAATYMLTTIVSPAAGGKVKAVITNAGNYETYVEGNMMLKKDAELTLTAESADNYNFIGWDTTTDTGNKQITLSDNQSVTANFEEITIYGTYDFRSFAKTAFSANGEASIDENETPVLIGSSMSTKVMKGTFTGLESATVTGSMKLNDVFGMFYSADTYKMKLVKTDDDATTGIAIPRGTSGQVELILYGLKQGDWFKFETGDIPLYINKVNNSATISFYDLDDVTKTSVARNTALKAGHTYVASADIATMELYYNTSDYKSGNLYLYSAQVSNGDAVPAPTIGGYDFATGKVDITVNSSLKGVTPTVYYTTDGSDPTTSSAVYNATDKISLTEASTIKAMAYIESVGQSTVAEKEVQLEIVSEAAIGDMSEDAVTITAGTTNNPTEGVTVTTYYTLDGSTPTAEHNDGSFTETSKAIAVDQTRFIKAITISSTGIKSEVVTKKITVDAATPATTWDFVNDNALATLAFGDQMGVEGYYYTTENGHNGNFRYITNAPVHSKFAWLIPDMQSVTLSNEEGQGLKDTSYRAFTINDLHKDDKIYITYTGGDLNVSAHSANGNSVTAGGTAVTKGSLTKFESGAEIEVTDFDATYNYVAFKASSKDVVISKIEINPAYQITGVKGTGISNLEIKTPSEKTFDDSFARGTEVTLKATVAATGGEFLWTDGDGNTLTPSATDASELTLTLTSDMTVNVAYSRAKIWDFSELTTGSISTVSKSKDMYYLVNSANSGRTVTINGYGNTAYTWNFPDGTAYSRAANTGNYAVVPGNGNLAPVDNLNPEELLDKQDTDDKYNRALAFTTTQAGTVYVAFQGASSGSEFTGRYYKLFFKPASGSSYEEVFARDANIARTANSRLDVLYYTASEPGTFVIGGGAAMNIYYVKFEPTDAENIVTLTETASPEGSGSVKREIVYGETPNYYETPASTFLAGTKLRLTPAANVGYGFTYWGDDADDTAESKTVTMDADQSVKVNFEEVKHQVTVAAAENGTVALAMKTKDDKGKDVVKIVTLDEGGKAEVGEGAEVFLLARPNLFYTMSGVTVTKTDATTTVEVTNGKFTIPAYDVTITPSFTAENSISEGKTWTFSNADETTNTIKDFGDGLYLRAGSKAFTRVESGSITSVTLGGETISVSSALQTPSTFTAPDAGNTSATAVSPLSSGAGIPMMAFNADTKGTLYVAASPVADGTGQMRIYFSNGTEKPAEVTRTSIPSKDEVYTASYTTYVPGTFYLGTTVAGNIYAVKFVPMASSDGVTLTQDGTSYVLSNGKVTAVINEKGQVDQLLTEDGQYIVKAGSSEAGCLDYTSNGSNRELQKGSETLTVTKVKETSDMVELRFTNDQNNLAQTWSIGYIMRKDVSGLYTYATMEGVKGGTYQEARFKWRPNESFNYAWVSDDVQGQMPPYDRLVDDYKVQDATFTLADGTIYTKYDWANYVKDDLLHGVMNTTNGAWAIAPNMEWMNGGVQKQELTVHADNKGPVLLQMLQGEHFGAAAYTAAVGSKQFYGPTLLYINSGDTKDAMIADAKQQAAEEVEAWPYSWFSHDDYPTAADRATVTGTITLNKDDFSTKKLQVILADASTDEPLQQSGGYQYATEVSSTNGSYEFTIDNVRPGNYALFAYALDGDATGTFKSSKSFTIAKGNNNVGTVAWTPAKYKTKLWQIGEADRTTSGFKLSDHKRQYGMWDGSVVADAGIPTTLTYTSTESDWYYAQTKDNSKWTVKFNNTETYAEPLHLTIAVAGSSRKPTLTVNMNDTEVYKAAYPNSDGALYRSGVLSGRSGLIEIEIPAAAMKVGENNLTLALSGGDSGVGGLLYDCIKLEAGESEVEDLGNRLWDFSEWTFDEGATKKNLTEVTNSKNLYYRAGPMNDTSDGRSIAINKNTVGPFTWNFPDGETYTRAKNVGNYATLPGNVTLAPANDLTPDTKLGESLPTTEDSNNRSFAFTTTKAGTLYVAFRGTENRDYQVFFKPVSGESYNLVATSQVDAADSKKGILFYTASEGGHFLIGGAAAMTAYLIKFEPAETTYKLTANVQPANCGTVKKDIVYTVNDTEKTYATTDYATVFLPGTKLSLTAVANGSNTFKGWDDTTETGSKIITMTADQTVTANFNKVTFSATYLPETIYQEEGEFTFDTETTVSVWTAEKNSTSGEWEAKRRSDYQYLTNMDTNKVSVRVGAQSITYGEDNSIRLSRPMAIHNLDVDDEITILYAGAGSLASVTTAEGDDFTIDGTAAEAGKAIPSGALLKVTGISTGDNYVVVGPASSSPIYIKGIYINTKAPEFLHTPTVELKAVDGETAVYTISYDEGATLHYQLSTEENEQEGDTSGAFDLNITESAKMTAWTTKGDLKSENLETTIFAPTPAPSEDGNFDFSEASEDLPADMEVTLDEKNPVTVEGETFYKPSALTAATFDDKFAFSETTTSDKIKIRTNRQLVFAKGADMDMAILNLKKGDIIAFDYSGGTIEFSASDIITTDQSSVSGSRRAVAANETVISGENYVVTGEGNLILHLKLTTTAVSIAKMALTKVAEPSAPKALDFATTQEEDETLEEGHAVTVYYNGQDTSTRFFRLNNNSEWLPAEGKISTPSGKAGLTTGGLKIDRNRFAIHDLAVGDTIKIRFYGGELTFEGHATKGDKIKVKSTGAAIEPGAAMESGVTIVVDKVDYLNNYLVFMLDKTCVVSGIFINKKETEKIIAPSLRDRGNGTLVQITPGRSTMDREVFTCYTTDGTDPSMVNGTSGIMTDVFDLEIVELHDCDVLVKAISYSRDGAISKMVEVTVQVTGIITDISGVPTIDGKPATIYDLRGHKVTTMMKGQIYIINGKKYLYK